MSYERDGDGLWTIMKLLFFGILIFGLAFCRGCVPDEAQAISAAEAYGFKELKVTDCYRFMPVFAGCSGSDAAAWEMFATNAAGKRVKIVVCVGWPMKAATVRVP